MLLLAILAAISSASTSPIAISSSSPSTFPICPCLSINSCPTPPPSSHISNFLSSCDKEEDVRCCTREEQQSFYKNLLHTAINQPSVTRVKIRPVITQQSSVVDKETERECACIPEGILINIYRKIFLGIDRNRQLFSCNCTILTHTDPWSGVFHPLSGLSGGYFRHSLGRGERPLVRQKPRTRKIQNFKI